MSNSIDHIVNNILQMGPNFTSLESVKNIACIGQKINKFELKEVHIGPTQTAKKFKMRPNLGFLDL